MISQNLYIKRNRQGISLSDTVQQQSSARTVGDLLQLPMNFYFMDQDGFMRGMNERTAQTCGYVSVAEGVGKSIRDVANPVTVNEILRNNQEVMQTQNKLIKTESYTTLHDSELTALSLKFPWYSENKIAGIFGCSILLNHPDAPDLPEALSLLLQSDLLTPDHVSALTVRELNGAYLNERDWHILSLLIRGKTARQIGHCLSLSHRTIEHRLEAIKCKLSVSSKSELIELVMDSLLPV